MTGQDRQEAILNSLLGYGLLCSVYGVIVSGTLLAAAYIGGYPGFSLMFVVEFLAVTALAVVVLTVVRAGLEVLAQRAI